MTARRLDWQRGRNGRWIRRLLTDTPFTRLRPAVVVGLLSALFLILPAGAAGSGASPDPAPHASSHRAVDSSATKDATNQPAPDAAPTAPRTPQPTAAPGFGRPATSSGTVAPVTSPSVDQPRIHSGAPSSDSDSGGPELLTRSPHTTKAPRATPVAKRRTLRPSHSRVQGQTAATHPGFPASLARRLDVFRPATSALSSLTRHDGTLVLLSALAMLVLLIASSSLLRLLARSRGEGWEG